MGSGRVNGQELFHLLHTPFLGQPGSSMRNYTTNHDCSSCLHRRSGFDRTLGAGLRVSGIEIPEQLSVELLPLARAEHDAVVAKLVAGREVDCRRDVWVHLARGSKDRGGGGTHV